MINNTGNILLFGLQETGKTSFLAALWYMLNQKNVPCDLSVEKLDGESKYLNEIRDAWLEYKPVPRNPTDSEKLVSMLLKDNKTARSLSLTVPDLSGESFKLQWTNRQISIGYDKLLRQVNGSILFIHPQKIKQQQTIDDIQELVEYAQTKQPALVGTPPSQTQNEPSKWNIEEAPTQVQLVELLQIISSRDYFQGPLKLAIVISAFDLVSQLSPDQYVSRELPLLRQFLAANEASFEFRFYGISAQGGNYASPLLLDNMLKDLPTFSKHLSAKGDPVSGWIWEKLNPDIQTALQEPTVPSATLKPLVHSLNEVISSADFYDDSRFSGFQLRTETERLLRQVKLSDRKMRTHLTSLNRMLMEDAYPNYVSKDWQFQSDYEQLRKARPWDRIQMTGPDIQDVHDITAPIKWLTH